MKRLASSVYPSEEESGSSSCETISPKSRAQNNYLDLCRVDKKIHPHEDCKVAPSRRPRKLMPIKIPRVVSANEDVIDDDEGHLNFDVFDVLDKYRLLGYLGKGAFSRVAKARNIKTHEEVALKIIRSIKACRRAGQKEIDMLENLRSLNSKNKKFWIQMLDCFEYNGHICIALELLGCSLYDFMKDNKFHPFTLSHTRQIAYQVCQAVKALHENFIVHTDLKPENICFLSSTFDYGVRSTRNAEKTCFRQPRNLDIKIVDFGCAEVCHGLNYSNIQTINYRSPEVVFDLGWSNYCDVWSIGCTIFELYTGFLLFPADDEKDLVNSMQDVLGPMPDTFLSLKSPVINRDCMTTKDNRCKPLHKYMKVNNIEHRQLFDLLDNLLKYTPNERITLTQALNHSFFTQCR